MRDKKKAAEEKSPQRSTQDSWGTHHTQGRAKVGCRDHKAVWWRGGGNAALEGKQPSLLSIRWGSGQGGVKRDWACTTFTERATNSKLERKGPCKRRPSLRRHNHGQLRLAGPVRPVSQRAWANEAQPQTASPKMTRGMVRVCLRGQADGHFRSQRVSNRCGSVRGLPQQHRQDGQTLG